MGSQTAFGPRGSATLLSKATTVSAVLFMITSLSLSILATRNAGLGATVLEGAPAKSAPAPAKSAPVPIPVPGQAPAAPVQTIPPSAPPANQSQPSTPAPPAPAAPAKK
jgi:preprotein translocase subunit SecG